MRKGHKELWGAMEMFIFYYSDGVTGVYLCQNSSCSV